MSAEATRKSRAAFYVLIAATCLSLAALAALFFSTFVTLW